MTAKQLFAAACAEALRSLRDVPVEKVLNRLGVDEQSAMQRALAQHFVALLRDAAAGVDLTKRPETYKQMAERLSKMRDVTPTED